MSLRALLVALGVHQAGAADINLNWNKLTDFTTDFAINYDVRRDQVTGNGKLQVDLFGERLKMVVREDFDLDIHDVVEALNLGPAMGGGPPAGVEPKPTLKGNEFFQFTLNVPDAFVSMRFDEHGETHNAHLGEPGADMNACFKIDFPRGLIDPSFITTHINAGVKKQIQDTVQQMPHQDVTVNGVETAVFGPITFGPEVKDFPQVKYFALRLDGTPFGEGLTPPVNGKWSPVVQYTNWQEGAGEIAEIPCRSVSPTELIAHPKAAKAFAMLDRVMASVKKTPTLNLPLAHFPEKPSLIFYSAAELEAAGKFAPTCLMQQPATSWSMVSTVIAGVSAGVASSLVVLMISKRSSRHVALLA